MTGAFERFGGFRRHVVFIVLGQHLACLKTAIGLHQSLRDHPTTFLEQVGKDAGEGDRDGVSVVGNAEAHCCAVSLHAALGDQPPDPKDTSARSLALSDLGWSEEKHQIAAKRIEHQRDCDADRNQSSENPHETTMAGL